MKTIVTSTLAAVLSSIATAIVVYHYSPSIIEWQYDQRMQQSLVFEDGFVFDLEDIRIRTYSDHAPWTRFIGQPSDAGIPMMFDLRIPNGESILRNGATRDRVPFNDKCIYETRIGYWPTAENLTLVATIYPSDSYRSETLTVQVPNPIHHHRLLDLDLGKNGTSSLIGIGDLPKFTSN